MAKTNANAPVGPWREGRPSFKAFYPEIIFLTIVTIAFVALAARLSCSAVKPKPKDGAPTPVSTAALFSTSQAFAQDAALDEQQAEATVANPSDGEPIEDQLEELAATSEPADVESAATTQLLEELDAESGLAGDPAATTADPIGEIPAAPQKAKSGSSAKSSAKILAIWCVCLAIPACLWIWRGWNWFVAIYGVRYEIRCDADNPKATTFLVTRGIFNKKTDSLHIAQIKDIQSSQSLWQKYFQGGVGTVCLTTSDVSDPVLVMKNMDEPSRVFNALDALRRHYWGRGGMQVNADGAEFPVADPGPVDVA